MDNDFGITMGSEGVAGSHKLFRKLVKIIDFPIEDHYDTAIFIKKGLLPAGNIHDGKPPVPEANARFGIQFPLIGATVNLNLVQASEQFPVDFLFTPGIK
jgi:hypothetical protein